MDSSSIRKNKQLYSSIISKAAQTSRSFCKDEFPSELFDLDIKTLIELIQTMTKYENKFNEEGNFDKAEEVKAKIEKINLFCKVKQIEDIEESYSNHNKSLQNSQKEVLDKFNELYDPIFQKLSDDYKKDLNDIENICNNEMRNKKEEVMKGYPREPNPSIELIKKHSELENLKKIKK